MNSSDIYLDKILENNINVVGEIYLITNSKTDKKYVGQTLSHYLNNGKYRPFGYKCRFNNHISAAKNSTIKNTYLINAIRRYGFDNFSTTLLKRCCITELDEYEKYYIKNIGTLYPNGYNLTIGGKSTRFISVELKDYQYNYNIVKKIRINQTDKTKDKISEALQHIHTNIDIIEKWKNTAITQHMKKRELLFNNIKIGDNNIEEYITTKKENNKIRYIIKIGDLSTTFYSKTEPDEIVKERAYKFLNNLKSK